MASLGESMATNLLKPQAFSTNKGFHKPYTLSLKNKFRSTRYSFPLQHLRPLPVRQNASLPRAVISNFSESPLAKEDSTSLSSQNPSQTLIHFYRIPFLQESANSELLKKLQTKISPNIISLKTEQCFNIGLTRPLSAEKLQTLKWLLQETFEPENLSRESFLERETSQNPNSQVIEVGPRMSFTTAWSTNAVSICNSCNLTEINRLERSRRYLLYLKPGTDLLEQNQLIELSSLLHDRMTECIYPKKLESFRTNAIPEPVRIVPVLEKGKEALEEINLQMGLAFDEQDIKYYTSLFKDDIKRNPTTVELFDIAQSNSEHSRHWFFNGTLIIDGVPMPKTLFQIVKETLKANPNNSTIGFKDNSSAIKGYKISKLQPNLPNKTSPLKTREKEMDVLFTAETHNFPCAVAPYPGAETGAGGRIRDTHATGRGSFVVASTAGYCVGNLNLEDSSAPWEDTSFNYPQNLASPLEILISASDGASDYGNKFGEPMIQGFTRSFGTRLPCGERREWLKPIMFSAGIGLIDHEHIDKHEGKIGMLVVKIGGPAYRIGMGGGAASSMVSGTNDAELDFNAVQRGDAEMAQKLYRVVRACAEMGEKNPIVSIHDQGAGGNCNVVKEIIYPHGAEIDVRKIRVGDETLSVLEIWGAEYQEQDALLIREEDRGILEEICERERVSMAVIGVINGSGKIVLIDGHEVKNAMERNKSPPSPVEDLELEKVLGDMPQKTFEFKRAEKLLDPFDLAPGVTLLQALKRVLSLPSVCSKRFLTSKVDRCVTGLVAQQQTAGPLQLPLSDVAVIAQSYTNLTGGACSIGEQPIKGLINPKSMARLAIGEALTNIIWAKVSALSDIKASGNWMYAAKLDGEGADMYDAAMSLSDCMIELGFAIDGGKDSLSMAARVDNEVVKAPGNLVISAYCTCPDITLTVTPDLKLGNRGVLLHLDLGKGKKRLGGSALAQAFDQTGSECPDLDDVAYFKRSFEAVQELIGARLISSGHDVSDGGLIVTVLEMAFGGNLGVDLNLNSSGFGVFETLFHEELGLVMEVDEENLDAVLRKFEEFGVRGEVIGRVTSSPVVKLSIDGDLQLEEETAYLRDLWEETSFTLEKLQRLEKCVNLEKEGLKSRKTPNWSLSFTPEFTNPKILNSNSKPKIAIIREEGSNGDREMSAAFHLAGFETWDITMSDLLTSEISLSQFRGIAFVGGFSYADVLDSAKGWSASIKFNKQILDQFEAFYNREDTFSLGVCNGCQLMALLGWIPGSKPDNDNDNIDDVSQPRFIHNESGKFECRFTSVKINESPSIMMKGMEGSSLGVWTAHGEGRAYFPDKSIMDDILRKDLVPVRYCDDEGKETGLYPFNPNGSPEGIAAICSRDGRHLAMMPHPERCFMMWQYPWYPKEWGVEKGGPSPWLKMFQNAREWCDKN